MKLLKKRTIKEKHEQSGTKIINAEAQNMAQLMGGINGNMKIFNKYISSKRKTKANR